jgi:glutamine---fructose-6-phosphate transaminase (isomerizing)
MYDEIYLQPEVVGRSLEAVSADNGQITAALSRARRVFLTGAGTSFHAACIGAWAMRELTRGRVDARAVQCFELATYMPGLRPDDLVIALTHSGETTMTVRALDRAQRAGTETAVLTGFPSSSAGRKARAVLSTGYTEERSWAHTASYTAAVSALFALANSVAEPDERLDLSPLPAMMTAALELDEVAHRLAASCVGGEHGAGVAPIVVTGGGPNRVTAQEAVLKLLETSYVRAAALDLEEALHGPLASITPAVAVLLLAQPGRSTDRAAELARALEAIGVTPAVLCGESNAPAFEHAHRVLLPEVPEVLSPLEYVVPLQLFSYYLAIGTGHNPDLLRRDDPRYREARARYA